MRSRAVNRPLVAMAGGARKEVIQHSSGAACGAALDGIRALQGRKACDRREFKKGMLVTVVRLIVHLNQGRRGK